MISGGGAVEPKQDVGQGGEDQQRPQDDDEQEDHAPFDNLREKRLYRFGGGAVQPAIGRAPGNISHPAGGSDRVFRTV